MSPHKKTKDQLQLQLALSSPRRASPAGITDDRNTAHAINLRHYTQAIGCAGHQGSSHPQPQSPHLRRATPQRLSPSTSPRTSTAKPVLLQRRRSAHTRAGRRKNHERTSFRPRQTLRINFFVFLSRIQVLPHFASTNPLLLAPLLTSPKLIPPTPANSLLLLLLLFLLLVVQ